MCCAHRLDVERRTGLREVGARRRCGGVQAAYGEAGEGSAAQHCHEECRFGRGGSLAARSANHLMGVDDDLKEKPRESGTTMKSGGEEAGDTP